MKKQLLLLQALGWALAFALFYVYLSSRIPSPAYALAISLSSFASFALLIYGYVYFLYPRYYRRLPLHFFACGVALFFIGVMLLRMLTEWVLVAPLASRSTIFDLGKTHFLYDLISSFFALVVGILFTAVIDNVARQKREAELRRRQAEAELQLLKAQLQPHFLFNSLNNLYFDVYKSLPEVAERIAMLSDIMRYFMEQSPQEKVPLATELQFIRNYIELERIRLPHPVSIQLEVGVPEQLLMPPMLLMPLVENLFKHGIDRSRANETASLILQEQEGLLQFTVTNALPQRLNGSERKGMGLHNLQERLQLLYGNSASLSTSAGPHNYVAQLSIPLL